MRSSCTFSRSFNKIKETFPCWNILIPCLVMWSDTDFSQIRMIFTGFNMIGINPYMFKTASYFWSSRNYSLLILNKNYSYFIVLLIFKGVWDFSVLYSFTFYFPSLMPLNYLILHILIDVPLLSCIYFTEYIYYMCNIVITDISTICDSEVRFTEDNFYLCRYLRNILVLTCFFREPYSHTSDTAKEAALWIQRAKFKLFFIVVNIYCIRLPLDL